MEPRLVVGLFRSSGIAEDARNRLKTEGVPDSEIAVTVLEPTAPVLPTMILRSRRQIRSDCRGQTIGLRPLIKLICGCE